MIALLRILVPLVILVVIIVGFLWPRYLKYKQDKAGRVDVDAEVINSEQKKSSDIPHSSFTTKPSNQNNTTNTKES